MSKDIFIAEGVLSECEGRWKFGDVALQAMGSYNTWMGFCTLMNFIVSPRQMRVIVVDTAEGDAVGI